MPKNRHCYLSNKSIIKSKPWTQLKFRKFSRIELKSLKLNRLKYSGRKSKTTNDFQKIYEYIEKTLDSYTF